MYIYHSWRAKKTLRKGIKHKKPYLSIIPLYLLEEGSSKEAILGYRYITSNSHHLIAVTREWEKVLLEGRNGKKVRTEIAF